MQPIENHVPILNIAKQYFHVYQFSGVEQLSQPFKFTIQLFSDTTFVNSVLDSSASLTINNSVKESEVRHGFITEVNIGAQNNDNQWQVTLILKPKLIFLEKHSRAKVFVNKNILTIAEKILQQHNFEKHEYQFLLKHRHPQQNLIIQPPGEDDLHFLQRLLAEAGIYYWFVTEKNISKVYFSDDREFNPQYTNAIPYIPYSGQLTKNHSKQPIQQHFYAMQAHYKRSINEIHVIASDQNHLFTQASFSAVTEPETPTNENWQSSIIKNKQAIDNDEKYYTELQAQRIHQQALQIKLKSSIGKLHIGLIFPLQADAFNTDLSNDYLITKIKHYYQAKQNSQAKVSSDYSNEVTITPGKNIYRPPLLQTPKHASLYTGSIIDTENQSKLNSQGQYQVLFDFVKTSNANQQHPKSFLPYLSMLLPLAGNQEGFNFGTHLLSAAHSRVIINHLYDDINSPIILGMLPKKSMPSVTTNANKQQNIISTNSQHQLMLEDTPRNERIKLRTANHNSTLALNHDQCIGAHINCQQGFINIFSGNNLHQTSKQHTLENIGHNKQQNITGNHEITTKSASIQQCSAKQFLQNTNGTISASSKKSSTIQARSDLLISTNESIQQTSCGEYADLHTIHGDIFLQGNNNLTFSSAENNITLGNKHSHITLQADGTIIIKANTLLFSATQKIIYKGKVHHKDF